MPLWIDARDLASARVEALLRKGAGNKRYVVASPENFIFKWAAAIMREEGLRRNPNYDLNGELNPADYKLTGRTLSWVWVSNFTTFELLSCSLLSSLRI